MALSSQEINNARKQVTPNDTINLPSSLIEELKLWKQASSNVALRPVSYAEFIRGMLDSLDETEPDITREMDRMIEAHLELAKKLE